MNKIEKFGKVEALEGGSLLFSEFKITLDLEDPRRPEVIIANLVVEYIKKSIGE